MQINKVQTTQPNFGTRVKADTEVLEAFSRHSGLKKQFIKFVEKLENNGRKDTLVITRERGYHDHYYNALVYETKPAAGENGSDLYRNSYKCNFQLFGCFPVIKNACKEKIDRLKTIYNSCYKDMLKSDFQPKCIGDKHTI